MTYALSFKLNMCSYPHNFVQVGPLEFLTLLSFTFPLRDQKVPCSPWTRSGSVTVFHLEATPPSKAILLGHAPDKAHLGRKAGFFVLGLHLIGAGFIWALKLYAFHLSYIDDFAVENRFKIIYIYIYLHERRLSSHVPCFHELTAFPVSCHRIMDQGLNLSSHLFIYSLKAKDGHCTFK